MLCDSPSFSNTQCTVCWELSTRITGRLMGRETVKGLNTTVTCRQDTQMWRLDTNWKNTSRQISHTCLLEALPTEITWVSLAPPSLAAQPGPASKRSSWARTGCSAPTGHVEHCSSLLDTDTHRDDLKAVVDKVHRSSTWVKVQIRIIKYYSSKSKSTAFSILLEWKYKSTQFFMYLSKKVPIDRFILQFYIDYFI